MRIGGGQVTAASGGRRCAPVLMMSVGWRNGDLESACRTDTFLDPGRKLLGTGGRILGDIEVERDAAGLTAEAITVDCSKCGTSLGEGEHSARVAVISGGIMGDEYIDSWYYCRECQVYTLETYRDRFTNEDTVTVDGPIDKATGDAKVALIAQCPNPWSKSCRCPAHVEYFGGWLD